MEIEATLLAAEQVAKLLGISKRQVFRMTSAGSLPGRVKLSKQLTRWRRDEIEKWVAKGCPPLRQRP